MKTLTDIINNIKHDGDYYDGDAFDYLEGIVRNTGIPIEIRAMAVRKYDQLMDLPVADGTDEDIVKGFIAHVTE